MLAMLMRLLLVLGLLLAGSSVWPATAQSSVDTVAIPPNAPPTDATAPRADDKSVVERLEGTRYPTGLEDAPTAYLTFKTPFEQVVLMLTVGTLAVTLGALVTMGWRSGLTPEFTRAFVVIVIVFAALFLIAAGYSDKQAAPVYGLLGTIAGYIFGKLDKADERPESKPTNGSLADGPKPRDQPPAKHDEAAKEEAAR